MVFSEFPFFDFHCADSPALLWLINPLEEPSALLLLSEV